MQALYSLLAQRYNSIPVILKKLFFSALLLLITLKFLVSAEQLDFHTAPVFSLVNVAFFVILLLLTLANWLIESRKWQLLSTSEHMPSPSLSVSVKEVLAGVFTSMVSPNRSGEFLGKILMRTPEERTFLFVRSSLGSMIQLSITLLFGVITVVLFFSAHFYTLIESIPWRYFAYFGVACILLLPLFFNRIKRYIDKFLPTFFTEVQKLKMLAPSVIIVSVVLSLSRYLVFSTQFVISLYLFGYEGGIFLAYQLIAVIYFVAAVIPAPVLAEIGIREAAAVGVFAWIGIPTLPAFLAVLLLWIINLAIPAFVGSFIFAKKEL
ncbi:MAG: lysylphosphatidylglycerol synthase domain-containing protein [Luteibaculaceae bacterium]